MGTCQSRTLDRSQKILPKFSPIGREVLYWFLGRRKRFVVRGDSMAPAFCDGDQVFVARLRTHDTLAVGDVVVARHPFQKMLIIKRVEAIHDQRVTLAGSNPQSSDSRSFGDVTCDRILGRVTIHLTRLTDELLADTLLP